MGLSLHSMVSLGLTHGEENLDGQRAGLVWDEFTNSPSPSPVLHFMDQVERTRKSSRPVLSLEESQWPVVAPPGASSC